MTSDQEPNSGLVIWIRAGYPLVTRGLTLRSALPILLIAEDMVQEFFIDLWNRSISGDHNISLCLSVRNAKVSSSIPKTGRL